jgi:gluconokinase
MPTGGPVVVVMGVSGVGKSAVGAALAGRLGVPFLDGDDLHPAANKAKIARGEPLDDADRAPWLASLGERLAAERAGRGLVLACSALKATYRRALADRCPAAVFAHLAADPAVIRRRLEQRHGHFAKAAILDSQLATLEPPMPGEQAFTVDAGPPVAEVVDAIVARLHGDR